MTNLLLQYGATAIRNYSVLGATLCLLGLTASFFAAGTWTGYIATAGVLLILVDVFGHWWRLVRHDD